MTGRAAEGLLSENRKRLFWRARLRAALWYWLVLPGLTISGGMLLDRFLPEWRPGFPVLAAGLMLIIAGCALIQKATVDLARYGGGTPAPQDPARRLVTAGSYSLCRHPMFLGYDLAAWGVGLLLASFGMLLVTLPLMLVWQQRFLRREEQLLARRFPETWPEYRRHVPLLIPRPLSKRALP